MLSDAQVAAFRRDGFVSVPAVLPESTVKQYRKVLADIFASEPDPAHGDVSDIRQDVISRYEALADLALSDGIRDILKSLLGEKFVILPETSIMDSRYGGWHTDMTTAELTGHSFRNDKDFSLVNAGFYFQENGIYGGGLDVVPGSHQQVDVFLEKVQRANEEYRKPSARKAIKAAVHAMTPGFLLRARRKAFAKSSVPLKAESNQPGQFTIPQRAGDLLIFDLRLYHKASWPEVPPPHPPHARKFAYFVICGADNATTRAYKDFLVSRSSTDSAYAYLRDHKYPAWLLEKAREAGVGLL